MSETFPDPVFPDIPVEPEPEPPGPPVDGWSTAPVTGDRIDVNENSFIAGDPAGARIEIRSTGFHAFNGTGTETAHIDGAEGVFVGGEFRTSDTLPGQVRLADDGYVNSSTGVAYPGIEITPLDTSTMVRPPGIGPGEKGMYVDGGKSASGASSFVRTSPTESLMRTEGVDGGYGVSQVDSGVTLMRTYGADGRGGQFQVTPAESRMQTYDANGANGWVQTTSTTAEVASVSAMNAYTSQIRATDTEAYLHTVAGGAPRYLSVDANGVWVKTLVGGVWKMYNLEQTAQDSGWQPLTVSAGITASADIAWRNKGGNIWFRGNVTHANWAVGWTPIATGLPASIRPASTWVCNEAGSGRQYGQMLRVTAAGELSLYLNADAPTRNNLYWITAMSYPAG